MHRLIRQLQQFDRLPPQSLFPLIFANVPKCSQMFTNVQFSMLIAENCNTLLYVHKVNIHRCRWTLIIRLIEFVIMVMTFETLGQSDEETWLNQEKDNDYDNWWHFWQLRVTLKRAAKAQGIGCFNIYSYQSHQG